MINTLTGMTNMLPDITKTLFGMINPLIDMPKTLIEQISECLYQYDKCLTYRCAFQKTSTQLISENIKKLLKKLNVH